MNASLQHAVERTLTTFDQLGAMWGPGPRPDLSVHRLTHDQVHALRAEEEQGFASSPERGAFLVARIETPLGWSVSFLGTPELCCARCRELLGLPTEAVEAAQVAGVLDRMDGEGM